MDLNKAMIIGRLTKDPEVRTTTSGQAVASFSLATNFVWSDQSGQKQERVEFHNIVVWRKLAEICGQYLKKGSKIYIEGRLQTRDWAGQDGVKRYTTEIIAENMIMLDSKGSAGTTGNFNAPPQPRGHNQAPSEPVINADQPANFNTGNSNTPSDEEEIKVESIPF